MPNIPFAVSGALTDDTAVTLRTVRDTTNQFYVTFATLSIVTHANGKKVMVRDNNETPKVICSHTDATAAAGVPSVVTWNFGKEGLPLTVGKNLQIVSESSGVAGYVYVEGYEVTD